MWTEQIVLGLIGLSSGVAVAGGLFAFIVELGVVADLADSFYYEFGRGS